MDQPEKAFDEAAAAQLAQQVGMYRLGVLVSAMGHLGGRLGLYAAMRGAGPLTADEVAERSGLYERWVLEWLRAQAAAGLIDYVGSERFELTDAQAAVLTDDASPFCRAHLFRRLPADFLRLEQLPESFQTGLGSSWADLTPAVDDSDSMLAQFHRTELVPVVLPALDGIVDILEAGGKVADVGCGTGVALAEIAKAFPNADLHGYDPWSEGLQFARRRATDGGFGNITFHEARAEDIPADSSFDLVCAMDCIHDMPHPVEALTAMRRAVKPGGFLLVIDMKGGASFEENLEAQPLLAAFQYSVSVLACLSSGMSEPDGAGLGTLGFDEQTARRMTAEAGFTRFRALELDHPFNAAYEVRP